MAVLESWEQKKIDGFIEKAKELNRVGNYSAALENLLFAWDSLPQPKVAFIDSYLITKYIIQLSLKNSDTETAKSWISQLYVCDNERMDDGEREYLHGRVAFAQKDFNKASVLFKASFKKSEGRSPGPHEIEYLEIINES